MESKKITVRCECGSQHEAPAVDELIAHLSGITGLTRKFFDAEFAQRISQADYDTHDCHLSEEDGCAVCVAWALQQAEDRRKVDEAMLKLQLGNI